MRKIIFFPENLSEKILGFTNKFSRVGYPSALDKLLGQLGTYATWLFSIAYLQKQLCIFILFYATFFSSVITDYTFSYCMKPSGMCLHIYSLPSSVFLKYQTSGVHCTFLIPLLTFERVHIAKVSLSS